MRHVQVGITVLVVAAIVIGCGAGARKAKAASFGKPIPVDMTVTTARELNDDPQAFDGKEVLVAGKITSECPSGGWIWVKDETGDVYVDMHPTNVFIPQHVNGKVRAMGRVVLESGRPHVVGTGLELR